MSHSPAVVCSFNVRYDAATDTGERAWGQRRPRVLEAVRGIEPALLGVQEALPHQYAALREGVEGYGWHGVGRRDGAEEGEFVPVAWRRERFEALETGAFWLSETPATPSVGWDGDLPRVTTWVDLRDRETGSRLWFCNTHFDHRGERARREAARLLRARACQRVEDGFAVVVTGDFNCTPTDEPYRRLTDEVLVDARRVASQRVGSAETFHGFTGEADERIDYVFVSRETAVPRFRTLAPRPDGVRSDHCPIVAEVLTA